eukprot:1146804-Pelagomonas_calceolata.AAC.1
MQQSAHPCLLLLSRRQDGVQCVSGEIAHAVLTTTHSPQCAHPCLLHLCRRQDGVPCAQLDREGQAFSKRGFKEALWAFLALFKACLKGKCSILF